MNQKEYELLANVFKDRKNNAVESRHFGYSEGEIASMLATINDVQSMLEYRLNQEYSNFDQAKFERLAHL